MIVTPATCYCYFVLIFFALPSSHNVLWVQSNYGAIALYPFFCFAPTTTLREKKTLRKTFDRSSTIENAPALRRNARRCLKKKIFFFWKRDFHFESDCRSDKTFEEVNSNIFFQKWKTNPSIPSSVSRFTNFDWHLKFRNILNNNNIINNRSKEKTHDRGRPSLVTTLPPLPSRTAFDCSTSIRQQGLEDLSARKTRPELQTGSSKDSTRPQHELQLLRQVTVQQQFQELLRFRLEFPSRDRQESILPMTQRIPKSTRPSKSCQNLPIRSTMKSLKKLFHLPPLNSSSPKPLLSLALLSRLPEHRSRSLNDRLCQLFLQRCLQLVFHLRSHRGCLPSALPPDLRIPHRSSGQFKKSLDLSIVEFIRFTIKQSLISNRRKPNRSKNCDLVWNILTEKISLIKNVHFTFPPKAICSQTCTKKKKYLSFAMKKLIWSLFY